MNPILEIVISAFLILGAVVMLIGSIGLAKFPDFYTRLHAPTKSLTLGVGSVLLASLLYFSFQKGYPSLQELLITMFLLVTAPVGAHMLAKTGLHYKVKMSKKTQNPELVERAYLHKTPTDES